MFFLQRELWQPALDDVAEGFEKLELARLMVKHRTRRRYHRASLGLFYVTIVTAAWAFGLGLLISTIRGGDPFEFVPFVGLGYTTWTFMSSLMSGGTSVFINGAALTGQIRIPLTTLVLAHLISSVQQLFYRLPIVVVLVFLHPNSTFLALPFSLLAFTLILVGGFGISILLGTLAARYRDLLELVEVILQFGLFMSGVFWSADMLGEAKWVMNFNPFYQAIEAVRGPLLNHVGWYDSLFYLSAAAVIVNLIGFLVFGVWRKRLPYLVSM